MLVRDANTPVLAYPANGPVPGSVSTTPLALLGLLLDRGPGHLVRRSASDHHEAYIEQRQALASVEEVEAERRFVAPFRSAAGQVHLEGVPEPPPVARAEARDDYASSAPNARVRAQGHERV